MIPEFNLQNFGNFRINELETSTGGPRYMREIGTLNRLAHNKVAYKKTKNNCKFEDRFQENCIYAKSQIKRPHITRATCTVKIG